MGKPRAVYTHGQHSSVLRSYQARTAADSAGYLLGELTAGASLLDAGCGPGAITADLAELVAPGRVVGVDANAEVLRLARAASAERGLSNVEFVVADVHALDFPDATFDVVHAHQVVQHVVDPVAVLREFGRVCAPGGVVGVRDADYAAMTWFPEVPALAEWLAVYRRTVRHNGGEPDAGRRLLSWARAAGFGEVTAMASTWCYAAEADRARWAGMWAERVVGSAFAAHAVGNGFATEADLARMAEGWLEWAAAQDAWFAVLHGEVLCRRSPR